MKGELHMNIKTEWEELVTDKIFITDLGEQTQTQGQNIVCRYAVWQPTEEVGKHQITEVGNNLYELRDKYQVSEDMVMRIRA